MHVPASYCIWLTRCTAPILLMVSFGFLFVRLSRNPTRGDQISPTVVAYPDRRLRSESKIEDLEF